MTDKLRMRFALRYKDYVDAGETKKMALFKVQEELKAFNPNAPASRTQIYAWCRKFGIKTR